MQSEVNEIDPVTVEVDVQVPWDRVKKSLDASYGKLQRSVRVRGFRPGKAPRSILRRLYGSEVDDEVIASLVEEGVLDAVQTHELAVVASPEVGGLPKITKGEPLSFKAKIEVRPKIGEINTDGLKVSRPSSEVTEAQVDAELQKLREGMGDLVTPEEPRPAEDGDVLTIDYTVQIDGETKEEMAASDRAVSLGEGRLLPEFDSALLGRSVGDVVEINVDYDEETANEALRGTSAVFSVTITALQEKVLPDLDDELAKDLGDVETLDELRAKVRADLERAARNRAESSMREQVIDELVNHNPIAVPPTLIDRQVERTKRELAFLMQMAGFDLGDEDELRERAKRKVHAALLMSALSQALELTVEPDEIDAKLREIAEASGKHIAKVRVEYAGEKGESLMNKLLEDKLLAFLLAQATVTDADPDASDEEE